MNTSKQNPVLAEFREQSEALGRMYPRDWLRLCEKRFWEAGQVTREQLQQAHIVLTRLVNSGRQGVEFPGHQSTDPVILDMNDNDITEASNIRCSSAPTLRAALEALGLPVSGTKWQQAHRLADAGLTAREIEDRFGWRARESHSTDQAAAEREDDGWPLGDPPTVMPLYLSPAADATDFRLLFL